MERSENKYNLNNVSFIYFEFYSGIGGMHTALYRLNLPIISVFPFDINPNANLVYQHNYKVKPFDKTLENLSVIDYEKLILNAKKTTEKETKIIWTMSPPCQPFTRQGNKEGLNDNRSTSFKHIMQILKQTKLEYKPDYFLLENVKGFDSSEADSLLKDSLSESHYHFLQFLLSPNDFNIPNSRLRFYTIAKKEIFLNLEDGINEGQILTKDCVPLIFKDEIMSPQTIYNFLNINESDEENKNEFYIDEKILNKETSKAFDIVNFESISTNCFTKAYSQLIKGSGSILLIDKNIDIKNFETKCLVNKLRYFTPSEIVKFMCFDENFSFPENITNKAKYKLLGNSLNVKVVEILLKYLFSH